MTPFQEEETARNWAAGKKLNRYRQATITMGGGEADENLRFEAHRARKVQERRRGTFPFKSKGQT